MDLYERDRELAALAGATAGAAGGTGAGVALVGEAGAGKSALVEVACARAAGLRVLRGGCDPLVTPRPLGPFRDLIAGLRPADLTDPAAACEVAYEALRGEPTVLVVEDAHWIDGASVEVLRFLVRRLEVLPCALVVTYRDDEIGAQHQLRPLLGDFAKLDGLTTLRLDPLTVDGVAMLLRGGPLDAAQVHPLTGGNPFFVAEVAKEPGRPLPATVRDAVLARTAGIAAEDLEVLQLAATAPDRLADRVLPTLGVDLPTLRRLHDTGLLLRDRQGLVFRHELARLAVESTIPAGGAARLHARLLESLERLEPRDPAVLTHHAVSAADPVRAARYAQDAAEEAARAGDHTDAVAFLRIAVANLHGAPPGERARVLTRLGYEQYMTSSLEEAIGSVTATFPLWHAAGDRAGLASAHESCALFEYYSARRQQAEYHADRAASAAPSHAGGAQFIKGYLAFLRSDQELAARHCADASRIAEAAGDTTLALRTAVVGAAAALGLGAAGARDRLLTLIEDAKAHGLDELASTGYSNLSYLDVEQRRLREAERVLEESLAFTIARDIPICNHWQTAVRARLRFVGGRWSAAAEDAADVLARDGMPLATLWPHLISALLPLRRDGAVSPSGAPGAAGAADVVTDHLDAAWAVAERLDEPLRRLPVLAALAERAWLTGADDPRLAAAPAVLAAAVGTPATAWVAGDLAVWLCRLGVEARIDAPQVLAHIAEPHRLMLSGHHHDAADWWRRAGAPYDEALALADAPDVDDQVQAIERLDLLGATAVADRLRLGLRRRGVAQLPQRPRAETRANPAGLTNRQLDVAKLVARGLTNAEIAGKLFISVKTADHHVSAVLTKLGLTSRRTVMAQAEALKLS
ncbi:helix-turn-helix transcriptional regulator [Dactylosporangium sp. NPDC000521]|uniref:helix-turn-helix transcriptional regulator n=1 Tax=Dactylosporangium sp. NPDC000521 TaxID=3363975 RepID=UPI003699BE64